MGLFGDIVNLIGGIGQLVQEKKKMDLAQSTSEQGQYWRQVGFQGLQGSIKKRQNAYNDIWKMVFGGVGSYDFSSMYSPLTGRADDPYYNQEHMQKREQSVTSSDDSGYVPPHEREDFVNQDTGRRARSSTSNPAVSNDSKDKYTSLRRR